MPDTSKSKYELLEPSRGPWLSSATFSVICRALTSYCPILAYWPGKADSFTPVMEGEYRIMGGKKAMKELLIWNKQTNFTPFVYKHDWWMGLEKWLAQVLPLAWWHGIFSTLPTRKMTASASEAWSFLSWMLTSTNTLRNEDYKCTQFLWVPVHTSCKGLIHQAQMTETWLVKMASLTPGCKCCGWEWQMKPGLFSPFIWCSAPCEQFQRHPPLPTVYG